MNEKIIAAAVGLVIGWAGQALTLTGRVEAIEKSLARIETRLFPPHVGTTTQEK